MCVLLCANLKVHEWLDVPLARAYRQSLQMFALCPSATFKPIVAQNGSEAGLEATAEIDAATIPGIMKRTAWIQAYCRRVARQHESTQNWHKPFESLANAWSRLLALVGLRR